MISGAGELEGAIADAAAIETNSRRVILFLLNTLSVRAELLCRQKKRAIYSAVASAGG